MLIFVSFICEPHKLGNITHSEVSGMTVSVSSPKIERRSLHDCNSYLKDEKVRGTCVEVQYNRDVFQKISSPPSSNETSPTASPQESPIFERTKEFIPCITNFENTTRKNCNRINDLGPEERVTPISSLFPQNREGEEPLLPQAKLKGKKPHNSPKILNTPELTNALSLLAKEIALMSPTRINETNAHQENSGLNYKEMNYEEKKNKNFLPLSKNLLQAPHKQSYIDMDKKKCYNFLRTSEIDPSPHQMQIPSINEILIHIRVCKMFAEYWCIDPTFDFTDLAGMSSKIMKDLAQKASNKNDLNSFHEKFQNTSQSRQILKKLCSCCDDIIVEGYFSSGKGINDKGKEVEVIILRSDTQRQFIVCYKLNSKGLSKAMNKKKRSHLKALEIGKLRIDLSL